MRVADAMSRDVHLANPDQSLMEAAKMMADCDCGALPVGENDRLVGMITDRDIVVRALARGKDGQSKIRDVMSHDVKYCFDDDDLASVAANTSLPERPGRISPSNRSCNRLELSNARFSPSGASLSPSRST